MFKLLCLMIYRCGVTDFLYFLSVRVPDFFAGCWCTFFVEPFPVELTEFYLIGGWIAIGHSVPILMMFMRANQCQPDRGMGWRSRFVCGCMAA